MKYDNFYPCQRCGKPGNNIVADGAECDKCHKPTKLFNEMQNVGTAKYVINYHNGVKTHKDGSRFYDIAIFKNKKKMQRFITGLVKDGYTEHTQLFNSTK